MKACAADADNDRLPELASRSARENERPRRLLTCVVTERKYPDEWGVNAGGKDFPERSRSSGMISRTDSAQIKLMIHFSGGRHA